MGPDPPPTPAWTHGWASLRRNPTEAFSADASAGGLAPLGALPMLFTLAPLPARSFCSGHLYCE